MMHVLGDIEFSVVREYSINFSNTTTQKAIEDGDSITDHMDKEPVTISFEATVTDRPEEIRGQLIDMRNEREVVDFYDDKNIQTIEGVIITDLTLPEEQYENGFVAQVRLQQIKIVERSGIATVGVDPVTNEEVQSDDDRIQERLSEEEQIDEDEPPAESWNSWLYESFGGDE